MAIKYKKKRRKKNSVDGCLLPFSLVVGIPIYLLVTYPIIIFIIAIPFLIYGIVALITWLKK